MGGYANNKQKVTPESVSHQCQRTKILQWMINRTKELDRKLQTCAMAAVTVSKMVVVV